MEDAFATAEAIVQDWGSKSSDKHGLQGIGTKMPDAIDWSQWLKIDAAERERGRALGKEREKFQSTREMLQVS